MTEPSGQSQELFRLVVENVHDFAVYTKPRLRVRGHVPARPVTLRSPALNRAGLWSGVSSTSGITYPMSGHAQKNSLPPNS
jgi:hypothetical protein